MSKYTELFSEDALIIVLYLVAADFKSETEISAQANVRGSTTGARVSQSGSLLISCKQKLLNSIMFRANKKLTQSVTFTTEDAADQALWDAIEKELSLTKYQTFSNLCKQALWQFLFAAESPIPSPTPTETSSSSPPASGEVRRWEERVGELQSQLSHLEQKMLTDEKTRFESLQRQLTQMTQQLAQLQVTITLQANSPAPQPGLAPPPGPTAAEPIAQEAEPKATPEQHSDPVLQRLSSLIDDF